MRISGSRLAVVAIAVLLISGVAAAQNDDQAPLYLAVECMKSTGPEYVGIETEIWQPMHQERVDQGKING